MEQMASQVILSQKRVGSYYQLMFALPALLYLILFFLYPLLNVLWLSISEPRIGLENYYRFFTNSLYFGVILNTFKIAVLVTITCLFMGYPTAYLLSKLPSFLSEKLLLIIVLPFWINLLVRNFALMGLLQSTGIINQCLLSLGIIKRPLELMHNIAGVIIGMTYMLLPFMILPIYSVMRRINADLINAAKNLGAGPYRSFYSIVLPLSITGTSAGALLVFILSLGFFVTPALLGGRKEMTISMLIEQQINIMADWGFASALAIILLVLTTGLLWVYNKKFGLFNIWNAE
jgi:putative spermidine/putrescine transport system permease protein